MSFWETLPNATLDEISHGWKMGTTRKKTVEKLVEWYGDEPTTDFIKDAWNILRDGWLRRSSADRNKVVAFLKKDSKGDTSIKVNSKAGQLRYLSSVRRTPALLDFVLSVLKESTSAYVEQHERFATPISELSQNGNSTEQKDSYTALAQQFLKFSDKTIESVEQAALFAILSSLKQIEFPVKDAHASSRKIEFDVIAALLPDSAWEEQTVDLLDYQKLILSNTDTSTWSARDVVGKVHIFRQFVQAILEESPKALNDDILINCYLYFIQMMFFDAEYEYGQETIDAIAKGIARFFLDEEEQESNEERNRSLDELLSDAIAQFPNRSDSTSLDNGALAWEIKMGSAVVGVFRTPYQERQPPIILLQAPVVRGADISQKTYEVLNIINKESAFKFYADDKTIWMQESFHVEGNSIAYYVWKLSSFLAAADYYDSTLQELFGGKLMGDDTKAEFDA
jgi:hypothetical protein